MQTPNTRAGRITEQVMVLWLRRLELRKEPRPTTATYNAAYESVLEVLDAELAEGPKANRRRADGG